MGRSNISMTQNIGATSPESPGADLTVAVIVPCFNSAKYLKQTIDSVLLQGFANLEVIAIDDGSTDGTREVLATFGNQIRVFTHPENHNCGQSATTNLGIEKTAAEIIAFIDADDIWFPGKLARQVDVLRRHVGIGVVYTGAVAIGPDDQPLYGFPAARNSGEDSPKQMLLDCHIQSPSQVAIRRSCLVRVGGFDQTLVPADHDMWLRLIEVTRFHFIDEPLVGYRKHPAQLSSVRERKMWKDGFRVLAKAQARYPYSGKVLRRRRAVLHYRLARYDTYMSKYGRAMTHYVRAVFYDPKRALLAALTVALLSVALD